MTTTWSEGRSVLLLAKLSVLSLTLQTSALVPSPWATPKNEQELSETICEVLSQGQLSSKDAERLRGRMIFFEGYSSGRIANSSVRHLGRYIANSTATSKLDDDMRKVLHFSGRAHSSF
ncbi:unnamed protein product [Effrenium voratum]|uniref:Uncharacterized protein n=1 Tax=Effrenium voratum TaxID=2562239 RepID=A0AA36JDW3_9DINO|nr:unnamed protein product [Effrenium voratum]